MPSQKGRRTRQRRASPWQGSVRLGMVFAVLIGVNVYFFLLRGGTSLRALMKTTELQKANPAAAPTGAIKRSFSRDKRRRRPRTEARLAPICNDGSSGPSEWPDPMASEAVMNFPIAVRNGMYPL